MSIPGLSFLVAFGVNPGTVPSDSDWVDLSDRLRVEPDIDWSFGRNSELDRMKAGTGSVRLDNSDRALDPTNEASPYWPDVKPMVRCKLMVDYGWWDVWPAEWWGGKAFEGFVEGWTPSWPGMTDSVVDVPVVDGFKLLSMARTDAAYVEEPSGTRIGGLLDAAGWPTASRDIDAGQSDVQALSADDRVVLSAVQSAAETEDGVFFVSPAGDATFRDRYNRVTSASVATFGDGAGELPYRALSPNFDEMRVWNDISATPDGMAKQRAVDETSKDEFGHRWLDKSTLHTSELDALAFCNHLLGRYATPRLRVDAIRLLGHADPDVLDQILLRVPGDRVTVMRRPPGGGDPIELDVFIEHVDHQIGAGEWITTWSLSPVFGTAVWRLGVPGFSELGQTTKLAY